MGVVIVITPSTSLKAPPSAVRESDPVPRMRAYLHKLQYSTTSETQYGTRQLTFPTRSYRAQAQRTIGENLHHPAGSDVPDLDGACGFVEQKKVRRTMDSEARL
jgi:hypothetical protein